MKQQLRQQTIQRLNDLQPAVKRQYESDLLNQLIDYIADQSVQTIGFYYGVGCEIDTPAMFDSIQARGVEIYLPRIEAEHQLGFHAYDANHLEPSYQDILQPTRGCQKKPVDQLNLLIVPGVCFKREGHRIGFGGGYYDRVLAGTRVPTVSLVLPEQLYPDDTWRTEPHDQSVDHLLLARNTDKESDNE